MNRWIGVLGVLVLGLTGCVSPQTRGQSAEETERDKDLAIRTIGDLTEVAGANLVPVSGVGLVTGLNGTGHSPKGFYRSMLEQQLRKDKVENVKALLDSPNNCLVFVQAFLPPGCRKGDLLDVEVTLPESSRATSLKGGYLHDCYLKDYDMKKHLSPTHQGADGLEAGFVRAHARGPLLVGLGNEDDPAQMRIAHIWGGGISNFERPFYFLMRTDSKAAKYANAVADKLNIQFQDDLRLQRMVKEHQQLVILDGVTQQLNQKQESGLVRGEMARAINKELINLRVPYAYRYNPERYLRVARLIPLYEEPEQKGKYRRRLQKMLLDSSDTLGIFRAALRLEALGKESVPALETRTRKRPLHGPFRRRQKPWPTWKAPPASRNWHTWPSNIPIYACIASWPCPVWTKAFAESNWLKCLPRMIPPYAAALFRGLAPLLDESPQRPMANDLGGEFLNGSLLAAPGRSQIVFSRFLRHGQEGRDCSLW